MMDRCPTLARLGVSTGESRDYITILRYILEPQRDS